MHSSFSFLMAITCDVMFFVTNTLAWLYWEVIISRYPIIVQVLCRYLLLQNATSQREGLVPPPQICGDARFLEPYKLTAYACLSLDLYIIISVTEIYFSILSFSSIEVRDLILLLVSTRAAVIENQPANVGGLNSFKKFQQLLFVAALSNFQL